MVSTLTLRNASRVLPVYLICDASGSMGVPAAGGKRPIDVLNDSIVNLFVAVNQRQSTVLDVTLSVISFSTSAYLNYAMDNVSPGDPQIRLQASGTTNLAAALELFEDRLDIDGRERYPRESYRPVAFILTDGHPTGDSSEWIRVVERLGRRSFPPRLIPCALGEPMPEVFRQLTFAYGANAGHLTHEILADGKDVAQGITSLFGRISRTLNAVQDPTNLMASDSQDQITMMDTLIVSVMADSANSTTVSFEDLISGY